MSGLMFSVGGKVDPSLKASLNQAVREAEAANLRIQSSLRTRMSGLDKSLGKMDPASPEYAKALQEKASLQSNLLMVQNAKYVAAARERLKLLDAEKVAERERYDISQSQAGGGNPRASAEAENAMLLRNAQALKQLIAERKRGKEELERYNASVSQTGGFANPRAGAAEHDAMLLRNAHALKQLIAERNASKDLIKYNQASSVSMLELAKNVDLSAGGIEKMAHGASGLNLIIRETLVVFREIGRGNWTRVPGSLSLIAQGFATLKGISMATLGAWALAIGGLIGSVFIYLHRLKKLAGELTTSLTAAFNPEHLASYLSKLEILNQLHKDVADSARQIQEAHDSVSESIQRELDLTRDKISFERELLEIQKANALAAAKNPAEREAIEKKYSALILANKKRERDAEFKALQDEVTRLPAEISKTEDQIKKLTGGDFVTEGRDAQILKQRQTAASAYDEYRRQLAPGEKDEREFSADKDRALIDKLQARIAHPGTDLTYFSDVEKLKAAKSRLSESARTEKAVNEWVDAKDDRDRARLRVKELEDRVKTDRGRLAALGPRGGGIIEDLYKKNLQKDQYELALEQERLKRVDPGRALGGREVTERQRVGFGSPTIALLDVNRSMDRKLTQIVNNTQPNARAGIANEGILADW